VGELRGADTREWVMDTSIADADDGFDLRKNCRKKGCQKGAGEVRSRHMQENSHRTQLVDTISRRGLTRQDEDEAIRAASQLPSTDVLTTPPSEEYCLTFGWSNINIYLGCIQLPNPSLGLLEVGVSPSLGEPGSIFNNRFIIIVNN
jgi:hypothetical protein